jgi:hypothetical protein
MSTKRWTVARIEHFGVWSILPTILLEFYRYETTLTLHFLRWGVELSVHHTEAP